MSVKETEALSSSAFVENKSADGESISFTLNNVNVSIANAIRRTILADIPIVVFKCFPHNESLTTIHKNTSRLNNEILKQRLESIPIHIKDLSIPLDDIVVEVNVRNDSDTVIMVTTNDFKIKDTSTGNYLDDSAVNDIFPADPITGDHLIFARLRPKISATIPGEQLSLSAKMTVLTPASSGCYNTTSACSYSFTPDKIKQDGELMKFMSSVTDDSTDPSVKLVLENDWKALEGMRHYIDNSFDFIIESVGVFTGYEIMVKALNVLIERIQKFKEESDNKNMKIIPSATTIPNSFDIILENETYTIGKTIEYILNKKYFKESDMLSFVGFRHPHPHDSDSIIRIAFSGISSDTEEVSKEMFTNQAYSIFSASCNEAMQLLNSIKNGFN